MARTLHQHLPDADVCPLCGGPRNASSPLKVVDDVLYYKGLRLHFTHRETTILCLLIKRRGRVVTKGQLFDELYSLLPSVDWPQEKTIDVFMCKLRKRLAAQGVPLAIETIWGRGWLLKDIPHARPLNEQLRPDTRKVTAT